MNTALIKPVFHSNGQHRCSIESVAETAPKERFAGAVAPSQSFFKDNTSMARFTAIHGGYDASGKMFLNDLHVFVPEILTWVRLEPDNSGPSPRMLHSICWGTSHKSEGLLTIPLFLYGGLDRMGFALSDFYRFDLHLNYHQESFFPQSSNVPVCGEWTRLESSCGQVPAMTGHSLTVRPCNSNLILFGGLNPVKLHQGKLKKSQIQSHHEHYLYVWSEESGWKAIGPRSRESNATLSKPCRRSGHSAMVTHDKLYIFGGIDSCHKVLCDLWEYDFDKTSWRSISNFYEIVSPHAFGSGILLEGWWILICQQRQTKNTNVFTVDNSNEKLCVQAYNITNETWASELSVQQKAIDCRSPIPHFFLPPSEYTEKQCRHVQELASTVDDTCIPLHAISIFTTRKEKLNPALTHVTGSIKRQQLCPPTIHPAAMDVRNSPATHAAPLNPYHTSNRRAEKQVSSDQSKPKRPQKRKLQTRAKRNGKLRKNKLTDIDYNSQDEIYDQAIDVSEFLCWKRSLSESCQMDGGWLHQFASAVPMDGLNTFMIEGS